MFARRPGGVRGAEDEGEEEGEEEKREGIESPRDGKTVLPSA